MDTRTKVELEFQPEDDSESSFQLTRSELHQRRTSTRSAWRTDYSHPQTSIREVLADGITRRQLAELIADGASLLAGEVSS